MKQEHPEMYQIVPRVMYDQSWKFHETPFICFSLIFRTDTNPTPNTKTNTTTHVSKWWSGTLPNIPGFLVKPILITSWKAIHPFVHNVLMLLKWPTKNKLGRDKNITSTAQHNCLHILWASFYMWMSNWEYHRFKNSDIIVIPYWRSIEYWWTCCS